MVSRLFVILEGLRSRTCLGCCRAAFGDRGGGSVFCYRPLLARLEYHSDDHLETGGLLD